MLAEDWPKYANRPGRNETPLSELSFETWVKQYKPSENFVNRAVSYYEKGFWTGMALDLELRLATGGRRGLPELIRRLWDRFGKREAPIVDADVRDAAAALAGRRMDRFFDRYIEGTDELPLPALWRRAGLSVTDARRVGRERAARGRPRSGAQPARPRLDRHRPASRPAAIRNVVPGSPAWRAGLTFNDEIVAVDGARVTAATFARRVGDHRPGARVAVAYFRRDQLEQTTRDAGRQPRA